MSGFGACQGSTCVCAIRAGLGEPGAGLEGKRRAPNHPGTGGRPASEPAGAGSLPALLALVAVAGAGGSQGSWWQPGLPDWRLPALGSALGAESMGWFRWVSPHTLASLLWGRRAQPRSLRGKPSLRLLNADRGQGTAGYWGTPDPPAAIVPPPRPALEMGWLP